MTVIISPSGREGSAASGETNPVLIWVGISQNVKFMLNGEQLTTPSPQGEQPSGPPDTRSKGYRKGGSQSITNIRLRAERIAIDLGESLEITEADIRFILVCRAIGYGNMENLLIQDGSPRKAVSIVQNFDFSRDVQIG
jgi:hypothetical protein